MEQAVDNRACDSVGIDLGTTNSSIAYLNKQMIPVVVLNEEGKSSVPSVVFFDDEEIHIGDIALMNAKTDAERVVQFIKVRMGTNWRKTFQGDVHSPESISAIILKHLLLMAKPEIGLSQKAVITVPAYFDDKRRQATQDAGKIAGLDVTATLNEPMAALLAYGLHREVANETNEQHRKQNVLVYDLGGGTFDVTVVEVTPTEIRELATDGNRELGGKDWDQALIQYIADEFRKQHKIDLLKELEEPQLLQARQDLQIACEEAKQLLSKRRETSVRIFAFGQEHKTTVTREQFNQMTRSLLGSTIITAEKVLSEANLEWRKISRILLVGGSTLMPAVKDELKQLTGSPLEVRVNPLNAVALGASVYAHILECGEELTTVNLRDQKTTETTPTQAGPDKPRTPPTQRPEPRKKVVIPAEPLPAVRFVTAHGVGIKVLDANGTEFINKVLIGKNSRVPQTSPPFRTQLDKPSQPGSYVKLEITQGDSTEVDLVETLGEVRIEGFPPRTKPSRASATTAITEFVSTTLKFDEKGRLQVSAEYEDTATKRKQFVRTTLDVEGCLKKEEAEQHRQHMENVIIPRLYQPE
jgi:molecular chaperone DnaK